MGKFLKFIIGGFLTIGSIVFGVGLIFSMPFAMAAKDSAAFWVWVVVDIFAFLSGIFLMRSLIFHAIITTPPIKYSHTNWVTNYALCNVIKDYYY